MEEREEHLALLKKTDKKAVFEFCNLLRMKLGSNLQMIKLFGSKARGDDDPESDIDILILVERRDILVEDQILDIAYDTSLKHNVVIMPVVLSDSEFYSSLSKVGIFYSNVQKEGVVL